MIYMRYVPRDRLKFQKFKSKSKTLYTGKGFCETIHDI